MGLYEDLKKLEPFSLSYHSDPDGIYSASLLMSVFKVSRTECPPFGEYNTDVAVDLGPPSNKEWSGLLIDHHPESFEFPDKKFKLYYDVVPTGLIIYNNLKDYIPEDQKWKVVGALVGDAQPERVPDEIWDKFPILLEERGYLGRGQYKIYASAFPLFYFLSSGINAIARLGFPEQALEIVNNAKGPLDILDNIEVKDALERLRKEEDSIFQDKPVAETIKNRYIIVKISPSNDSVRMEGYLASKLSGENPGKTIIVINTKTGAISIRGLMAKYVANKLKANGIKAGGHYGACLNKGTLLFTTRGYIPIENIQVGDKVMDKYGKLVPVKRLYKKESNDLYRIFPKYSYPIELTGDHKVLTFNFYNQKGEKVTRRRAVYRAKVKKTCKYILKEQWKEVKDLDGSELLAIPKPKLGSVLTDPNILKLLGWYIAEGHIEHDNKVVFTLNKNEISIAEELKEIAISYFEVSSAYIKEHSENAIRLTINSKELVDFCSKAGKGAFNKKIPDEVFFADNNSLKSLIDAIKSGDGYSHKSGNSIVHSIITISKELVLGLRLILLKLSYLPSIKVRKNPPTMKRDGSLIVPKHPAFTISWNPNPVKKMYFETTDFYLVPFKIEKMENRTYDVYDLETEGNFDAGIVVHNCGANIDTDEIEDFLNIIRSL